MELTPPERNDTTESDCDLKDCESNNIQSHASKNQNRRHMRSPKIKRQQDNSTVLLSIGGKVFETYRSTLRKISTCRLANDAFLQNHFRKEKGDYFFDRDPTIFSFVLNYLRTGELHLPSFICGPSAKRELEFWGVEDCNIETCCWTNYASWNSTLNALKKLELDRKVTFLHSKEKASPAPNSCWQRSRRKIWLILNNKGTPIVSKIYGWASLIFVFMSIFALCAETHEFFRVPGNTDILGREFGNVSDQENLTPEINKSFSVLNISSIDNGYTSSLNDTPLSRTDRVKSKQNSTKDTFADVIITSSTEAYSGTTSTDKNTGPTIAHPVLVIMSVACLIFFVLDYSLRVLTAPRRCKFIKSSFGIIDVLALLPDAVELVIEPFMDPDAPLQVLTILRIMRVIRILRLMRHFSSLWLLFYTLKASIRELLLLSMFLFVGVLTFSTLIFFADNRETFSSIPQSFWWALITMTTVGYGDMYPSSFWGYIVGSMAALSGLLMIGFSVPVLVNNFLLYYTHVQYILDQDEDDKLENNNYSYRRRRSSLYESSRKPVTEEDISLLIQNLNNRDSIV